MAVLGSGKEKAEARSSHCAFLGVKITGKSVVVSFWHIGTAWKEIL